MDPEQDEVRRLGIRHHAMDDPGIGIEIAAGEGEQQRDLHRFIAAYRRAGGNIQ